MPSYRLAPDAILVQTNLVGVVTVIQDDPDSPDALWMTASSTSTPSDLRVSFPTPTEGVPDGQQELRFRVRKVGGTNTPVVTVEVYDGATLVASTTANVTTSQVISLPWTGTGNGTSIEARVFSNTQGGKASVKSSIEVGAIEWNALTAAQVISGSATITQTHTVEATGIKQVSGSASISQANAVTASGMQIISREGSASITQTHSVSGSGTKEAIGYATVPITHLIEAAGTKAVEGFAFISQSHSVTASGSQGETGGGITRKGSIVIARGITLLIPPLAHRL